MKYILFITLVLTVEIYSQEIIGTPKSKYGKYITAEPHYQTKANRLVFIAYKDSVFVDSIFCDRYGDLWCKVRAKGHSGYYNLNELYFENDNEAIVDSISKIRTKEYKAIEQKIRQEEKEIALKEEQEELVLKEKLFKERKVSLIKKYGKKNAQRIIDKKIWLGMSNEMARESWGEPNDINRTVGRWGVHEQWVYDGTYLYFENGKLTGWQD